MSADPQAPVVALVVAVAENGVIGKAGGLPWRLPSDLKAFRRLTLGKPVVMGRRTFQSIGRPLDGRDNIVVTRDRDFRAPGVTIADGIVAALDRASSFAELRGAGEIMVIGGAEVYRAAMPYAGRIYWTQVHASPDGDVTLASPDPAVWTETGRTGPIRGEKDEFSYSVVVYERLADGRA